MNIRVQPTVRCSFVAEENVLRIVLKENVGGAAGAAPGKGKVGSSAESLSDSQAGTGTGDAAQNDSTNQEVVVYALKVRSRKRISANLIGGG